jgi:uncharacterized protein (TIGR02145 family)
MFIKLFNKFIWSTPALLACLLFSACGSDSTSSPASNTEAILSGESISGVSQKGPFVKGSTVKLYELDEELHQTGVHYSTTIDNDEGKYHIDSVVLSKPYAWMIVNGYFLNEHTGEKSTKEITLNGLVKVEKNKDININVLSHLAFNRINYLVQQGLSIGEAQKQAEAEVLKAFGFEADETSFDNMNIFANNEGDAKLLAISLILLKRSDDYDSDNAFAQTIDRMAQITYDLETDGTWDDDSLKEKIKHELYYFADDNNLDNESDLAKTRKNIETMTTKPIPNFEKYIKKFMSPDTVWGSCSKENEIQKNIYNYRNICQNSIWTPYKGFRDVGDPIVVDTTGKYGTLIDSRNGNIYKTLTLVLDNGDSMTWMAENLEFGRKYKHTSVYDNTLDEETEYLDDIDAKEICPEGWHISSTKEWNEMHNIAKANNQYGELLFYQGEGYDGYLDNEGNFFPSTYVMSKESEYPEELYLDVYNADGSYSIYGYEPAYVRCIKDYKEKEPAGSQKYGHFIDERDGQIYKTIDIKLSDGTTATWMASLLEYEGPTTTDSKVQHYPGHGRTYTYKQILNKPDDADTTELYPIFFSIEKGEKVQGICPNNYHIPNYQEWNKLLEITASDSTIKELLLYPQSIFNKTTNSRYTPYDLKYNFNVTGEYNREQNVGTKWVVLAILPPFASTLINEGLILQANERFRIDPFALRCVKD